MAGVFVQVEDDKGLSQNTGGGSAATLSWIGYAPDEQTALADENVPKRGQAHPTIPGLTADDISAVNTSGLVWTVRVQYSNDGSFIKRKKVKTVGYFEWTSDYKSENVSIPYAKRMRKRVARPGSQDTLIDYYDIDDGTPYQERRTLRILETVVARTNYTQFDAANREVGSVHEFSGGIRHRLEGFTVDLTSEQVATVKYTYMIDPGTPYINDQAIIRDEQGNPIIIYREIVRDGGVWLRAPFTQTIMTPSNQPFLNQPDVPIVGSKYTARFGSQYFRGWINLPGFREPQ